MIEFIDSVWAIQGVFQVGSELERERVQDENSAVKGIWDKDKECNKTSLGYNKEPTGKVCGGKVSSEGY